MNIVKQKWEFLNSTLPYVPKQARKLYQFGLTVLAFRAISSLRSNARLLSLNWYTAKSKIYRLTINQKLINFWPVLLLKLGVVRIKDVIAVDFSDFDGFQVLMFAKQTHDGRALPVYFEILTYPIKKGSQNLFIIKAISNFTKIIGFKPTLVFDRGFACPWIVDYLAKNRYRFLVRVKRGKKVIDWQTKKRLKLKNAHRKDFIVAVYRHKLRVVISDHLVGAEQSWYLVTNDFDSRREKVLETYYHRFEIEELFRDAKRLLGLESVHFQKEKSLVIVLWFVIVGLWFLWTLKETEADRAQRDKMRLSRLRYFFEKMKAEIFLATEAQFIFSG